MMVSRVSVITLLILRYLIVKNSGVSFAQMHLEISFASATDAWDLNDQSLRQILTTMTKNDLLNVQQIEDGVLYSASPKGYAFIRQFMLFDKNILEQCWRVVA